MMKTQLENAVIRCLAIGGISISMLTITACKDDPEPTQIPRSPAVQTIDSLANLIYENGKVPGLNVLVLKGGNVLFEKSYGVTNLQSKQPVTSNTRFHIGSTSKGMTALAIMQLADKGQIKLDERVTTYLPDFRMNDPRYRDITVRHLLTNSSGIASSAEEGGTDADALASKVGELATQSLSFAPGEGYEYANQNWSVLGLIIQRINGIPYEAHMQQNLFDKIGMSRSTFQYWLPNSLEGTQGYALDEQTGQLQAIPALLSRGYGPAGMAVTTLNDTRKYLTMLLRQGRSETGEQVVSEASLKTMFTPQVQAESFTGLPDTQYGFGWEVVSRDGTVYVEHGGEVVSMGSYFILQREKQVAVALLFNQVPYPKIGLIGEIAKQAVRTN